jgi:hypothetical protein
MTAILYNFGSSTEKLKFKGILEQSYLSMEILRFGVVHLHTVHFPLLFPKGVPTPMRIDHIIITIR